MKKTITLFSSIVILWCLNLSAQNNPERNDSLSGKRLFKVDFMAPATGNFTMGYEQHISQNTSLDFELGVIGIGRNPDPDDYPNKAFGLFLKAGPCLYISSNYYNHPRNKTYSCFQGTYLKPTLSISSFSYSYFADNAYYPYQQHMVKANNTSGALLLNIGHQFVFKQLLSFNFYAGMGYYIRFNNKENDEVYDNLDYYDDMNYKYAYIAGIGIPVTFDGGVEIGLILKR